MSAVLLTKRIEFAAAHRYHKPEWDEAKNRAVFGACYNEPGHGHNYMLEVTVSGEVDRHTGMVVNLFDLKRVLLDVLDEFDHKHFNLDMAYFKDTIPTTENIARLLWTKLVAQQGIGTLHTLRLCEDEDLFADIMAAIGLDRASITRRYEFTGVTQENQPTSGKWDGHTYDLFVTVHGKIDDVTGMVTDIAALDRLVRGKVLQRFDGQELGQAVGTKTVTGEELVRFIWDQLVSSIHPGKLERVKLVQTRDLAFEYSG
jgi:6-pyruvoyltetrahydropterin/6-carboxytetrahydropterin synthase